MRDGGEGDIGGGVGGGGGGVGDEDEAVSGEDHEGGPEVDGGAKRRRAFGLELDVGEERALDLVGE